MTWTPTEAIHLVSSDSAAGHAKEATRQLGLRRHVRVLGDRLTIGPCDADPVRHAELRRAWNAGDPGLDLACGFDDLRVTIADDLPVVVWASLAYEDLVWSWWVMDGLTRLSRPAFIVRPESRIKTVSALPTNVGRAALKVARPINDDEYQDGVMLWRLFASPDPRAFDEVRKADPGLRESAEPHGAWFPRLDGGRLRLSERDNLLLGGLTESWMTPWAISIGLESRTEWPFRAFEHVRRLREWAAHGAVERENRDPGNDNPFKQDVFRSTDRTRALLENGLGSASDAPPLYVGGCKLNDPAAPWVRVADGEDWRVDLMVRT